ncbi:hypothetical protein [Streptomyces beijiangensis]|uniref:Uncharacterized protein n=1 Tax=Streptomyces beijiangensis TaxID=163361 RepID=A0A939JIQ3_9ACTN|nr:hypothetical protein [Streptomyces beijiangensis]MBO0513425.1 hypothetical protein [Streptomyces beijiangensis]
MNAIQQHMLDAYRASQRGEQAPPLPGRHDWQVVREFGDHRDLTAALAAGHRPARGRLRRALARVFH